MDIKFRKLKADEIDVRIGQVNKGGVSLLLYKDSRADMKLLDETVGPTRWQRHHSRDNANCIVSIYDEDLDQWIEKEDTGTESFTEKEKGIASDSFKRACTNWGIGRELYTSPNMFIKKEHLKGYQEGEKPKCFDTFKVTDIQYDGDSISSVTIEVSYYGTPHYREIFRNATTASSSTPTSTPRASTTTTTTKPTTATTTANTAAPQPTAITDDTVLLMGNCKGKTYGEVKNTATFASFMKWVKTSDSTYPKPEQQAQFLQLKKIANAKEVS